MSAHTSPAGATLSHREIGRVFAKALTGVPLARRILRGLSHSGFVPPSIWKRLPVGNTFVVPVPTSPGSRFEYASTASDAIGRALFWRGLTSWEDETIPTFLKLCAKAKLVIDIGANTGVYTMLACAANPDLRAVAFEPVPRIFRQLCRNIALNGWSDRCTAKNQAVASFDGYSRFHVPYGEVPTSGSLNPQGFRSVSGELVETEVATVDTACSGFGPVDLVKIDVEGFEDEVLKGMHQVLRESHPAIIVECNPDGPYHRVQEILSDFGYRFFHIGRNGPTPRVHITPDPAERWRNYLCLPDDGQEWL